MKKKDLIMKKYSKLYVRLLLGLIISILYISCESQEFESTDQQNLNEDDTVEQAYPNETGELVNITLNGEKVDVESIDGNYILEGDIIVSPYTDKSVGRTGSRWPNNTVYYAIQKGMPMQDRITKAIAHWESKTALRFVKRTNQKDYVYFRRGVGCSSQVGRTGGPQAITLSDGCYTGSVIHEIGHAIGLWHEQSRKDRDKYVRVLLQNVQNGKKHNFLTYRQQGFDGREYTSSMDMGSIMMYESYAFSKNGKPTITLLNGKTYKTNRTALSNKDIAGINKMYPPKNTTTTTTTTTTTGGAIYIKGSNNKYVSSENGAKPMSCNRGAAQGWQKFSVIKLSGGKVALKGNNGKYVSRENGSNPITCNRSKIGAWEKFTLVSRGGNKYALKGSNGKYVSSENGSKPMTCSRTSIGKWEEFVISGL